MRIFLLALAAAALAAQPPAAFLPGGRVVVDAHNCYPYDGRWTDRIGRALGGGTPVAIEQDLYWHTDPKTGRSRSIVTHGKPVTGAEPPMEHYFFDRIRPLMERALADGNRGDWPLITLNLDFKTDEPAHHRAVWELLGKCEAWLTTAVKTADPTRAMPLKAGPLLVLTGEADSQQEDFFEKLPIGARLRLFGAVHSHSEDASTPPEAVMNQRATNYRRWWNNPWSVVEKGGQEKAGRWSAADDERLRALVKHAHDNGLWIRFYTLNGHPEADLEANGWFRGYNFGSLARVEKRWRAAIEAGADFLASDQYEALARFRKAIPPARGIY